MSGITEGMTMQDKIEKIGKSIIQHGEFNNRIYLLKLAPEEQAGIIPKLDELAAQEGYTKIFAKIEANALPGFLTNGYFIEGYVPEFFNGQNDCLMVSKFTDKNRSQPPEEELKRFKDLLLQAGSPNIQQKGNGPEYTPARLVPENSKQIAAIFKRVFETYPFPVHDPEYILKTMRSNAARYFGIWDKQKLTGVSTAETDMTNKNVEMTDFAVLPEYRGQKMAFHLLAFMEKEMKASGIKTAYTIARLKEFGMNRTFIKSGYKYTGTLVNNTNIGGSIESMNIFYKKL
jgi:beta-lysine N6-acetyltransferase